MNRREWLVWLALSAFPLAAAAQSEDAGSDAGTDAGQDCTYDYDTGTTCNPPGGTTDDPYGPAGCGCSGGGAALAAGAATVLLALRRRAPPR